MSSFANNAKLNEQHTSSPSNIKKTAHSAVKKTKSLSREFFSQLIKLEADFHNKAYTVSTLDELIQNYAVRNNLFERRFHILCHRKPSNIMIA